MAKAEQQLITKEDSKRQKEVKHLLDVASGHHDASCGFGRQMVKKAWEAGKHLNAAKAKAKHGEWLPALKRAGFKPDTAARLMRLNAQHQISEIQKFKTVTEALIQIPHAIPETEPELHLCAHCGVADLADHDGGQEAELVGEMLCPPCFAAIDALPFTMFEEAWEVLAPQFGNPLTCAICSETIRETWKWSYAEFDAEADEWYEYCEQEGKGEPHHLNCLNEDDERRIKEREEREEAAKKAVAENRGDHSEHAPNGTELADAEWTEEDDEGNITVHRPDSPEEIAKRNLALRDRLSPPDKWRYVAHPPSGEVTKDRTILEISCFNLANTNFSQQLTNWTKNELINRIVDVMKRVQKLSLS